jgi:hypothetical protein
MVALLLFFPASAIAQLGALPVGGGASEAEDTPYSVSSLQRPLSREERLRWFLSSTVGPKSLGTSAVSAAWSTRSNSPEEYGPHWDGFAKRYGLKLADAATRNSIEAGVGAIWGENPHYTGVGRGGIWSRLGHAARMTVLAGREDGSRGPAYARFIGVTGGSFLSGTWRVERDATTGAALQRVGLVFAGKFLGNVFKEFSSDLSGKVRRPRRPDGTTPAHNPVSTPVRPKPPGA